MSRLRVAAGRGPRRVARWLGLAGLLTTMVAAQPAPSPTRIITVIPAITDILFAVGAGPQVVGIGSFDQRPDGAGEIARVGGLLDPDMERIFSLRPDLVILYASQIDARAQLERAAIPVLPYTHAGLSDISDTIRAVGQRTGHEARGAELAQQLEDQLEAVRARVDGRDRPRTMLVFSREPQSLRQIYASGGVGFLHEMLVTAGGDNVFADVASERVAQVTAEAILLAAPEVIIEIQAAGLGSATTLEPERAVWQRLANVPAIRTDRLYVLTGSELVVPGPRVGRAVERLAEVLHPGAF